VLLVHASNTYGPRQYPEKLIPHMIGCALKGRSLPVYGQGLNVRDWMHVSDLVRGLQSVVECGEPGQTYNFAGRDEHSNIETVRLICDHLDGVRAGPRPHRSNIAFVTDRPGHDQRYAMSIEKVARVFSWAPRTRFLEGLPATIDWYLENGPWWQSIMDRGYGGKRIGLGVE
jgi:dTDP-glucose 4,6-dehydratase